MGTVTITFSVDQLVVDVDGTKIQDLGEVVKYLEELWKAALDLYTVNVKLATLEGARLGSLVLLDSKTKPPEVPK
jgi:hypothetical protein